VKNGIAIVGANTTTNTVSANLLIQNQQNGLLIDAARNNTIDHPYAEGNIANGIDIIDGATANSVTGGQADGNHANGIQFGGANTELNNISGTLIFNNLSNGIDERDGAIANHWSNLRMYGDGQKGADLHVIPVTTPRITSISGNGIITTVNGTGFNSGGIFASYSVEVYAVALTKAGNPEGRNSLGTALVDVNGNWSLQLPPGSGLCLTAVESSGFFGFSTGEFGPDSCRAMIPLVAK